MPQYLSISRAARVVGVPRNSLQNKIKAGELASFDGMLSVDELLRVFPQAKVEDSGMLERVTEIKDKAFGKRVFERALPDKEVLAERLVELGRELASTKAYLEAYSSVLEWLTIKMQQAEEAGGEQAQEAIAPVRRWLSRSMIEALTAARSASPLMVTDSLLRILEAHVKLLPSGHEFVVEGSESILQSALRAGLAVNYGCRDGSCGLCKSRLISGKVKQIRPHDFVLTESDKEVGMMLMCAHTAVTDLQLETREARRAVDVQHQQFEARVKSLQHLPGQIAMLQLHTPPSARLRFLAGQSVSVQAAGLTAELPVASCPCEERRLEFHLSSHQAAFNTLQEGDTVHIEGPQGEFVLHAESHRPLLFVAYGIGFAPVKSLIEHAMSLEAVDSMHLYWLAQNESEIYLANLCRAWADALDNFIFTPMVGEESVAAAQRIAAVQPDLAACDIYLSAPEPQRTQLKASLLAAGAMAENVFTSAF